MLSSILIISWDSAVRSESEPFAWAETLAQHYKVISSDLYLDYIDLHQDSFDIPFDLETRSRFNQAELVCLILNAESETIPVSVLTILDQVQNYTWQTSKLFLFTKKDQPDFADWSSVSSKKILVKQLASL